MSRAEERDAEREKGPAATSAGVLKRQPPWEVTVFARAHEASPVRALDARELDTALTFSYCPAESRRSMRMLKVFLSGILSERTMCPKSSMAFRH